MNERMTDTAWRTEGLQNCDGFITGSDQTMEWLLPYWLQHLRNYNRHPITIANFGMSQEYVTWLQRHVEVLNLSISDHLFDKRTSFPVRYGKEDASVIERYQKKLEIYKKKRKAWFTKPFAMLQTPYRRTVWLDVDCQVNGDISSLFSFAENETGVAMGLEAEHKLQAKIEDGVLKPGGKLFNSGVIAYLRGADLIQKWAQAVIENEGDFLGDQDILSHLIDQDNLPVPVFSRQYNWLMNEWGVNPEAKVLHWAGKAKTYLAKKMQDIKGGPPLEIP